MKKGSIRFLALASLASLALATSAGATTILQFGQQNPNDVVTATNSGSTTTLTTSSLAFPGSIPVLITNIGGTTLGTPIVAFETFTGVTSAGAAITTVSGSSTRVDQLYNGTIAITQGPGGLGGNFLTAAFTNADLSGFVGGGSASLDGSRPPQGVTFTSNFAAIVPLIAGNPPENFSISLSNVAPTLSVTGGTVTGFTAQNSGTFATGVVVPEPASIVMSSIALLVGLGCYGRRRLQSSQV